MDDLADPSRTSPILAAMEWLQATLLGTVATTVAIIAVAAIGYRMLTGRANWRYGVSVIFGCFVLFGASSIVAGIESMIRSTSSEPVEGAPAVEQPSALVVPEVSSRPGPSEADPYAGAVVPPH